MIGVHGFCLVSAHIVEGGVSPELRLAGQRDRNLRFNRGPNNGKGR